MGAVVIFDVELHHPARYRACMLGGAPARAAAAARHLARDGTHRLHAGGWQPRRIRVLAFASLPACEALCSGPVYQARGALCEACGSARLVAIAGCADPTRSPP
jgi:uncharacterized protein (DUF1330 family)